MKLKSWYIVLLGMIIQAGLGIMILSGARNADAWIGLAMALIGLFVLLASVLGVIPLLLLIFPRTRKAGGVVSILLGIAGIAIRLGAPLGIFLIIAGTLALWKKI